MAAADLATNTDLHSGMAGLYPSQEVTCHAPISHDSCLYQDTALSVGHVQSRVQCCVGAACAVFLIMLNFLRELFLGVSMSILLYALQDGCNGGQELGCASPEMHCMPHQFPSTPPCQQAAVTARKAHQSHSHCKRTSETANSTDIYGIQSWFPEPAWAAAGWLHVPPSHGGRKHPSGSGSCRL